MNTKFIIFLESYGSTQFYITAALSLILMELFIIVVFLFFKKFLKKKIEVLKFSNEEKKSMFYKKVSKIKKKLFIENVKIVPHVNKTFLGTRKIYLSAKDFVNPNIVFKLNHEIFHLKIFDNTIGYLVKFFLKVIMIYYILFYTGFIEHYIMEETHFKNHGIDKVIIIFLSLLLPWYILRYPTLSFIRVKECMCDRFASMQESISDIKFNKKQYNNITHPTIKERKRCINGDVSLILNILILNNLIPYILIANYLSHMGTVSYIFYISLTLEFLILFYVSKIFLISKTSSMLYIRIIFIIIYLSSLIYLNLLINQNIETFITIVQNIIDIKKVTINYNNDFVQYLNIYLSLYVIYFIYILIKKIRS